jgi:hypothetical protein
VKRASAHVVPLRGYLSEHWITAQIRYHEDTARRQGAWDSRLFAATGVLFLITAVGRVPAPAGVGRAPPQPDRVRPAADRLVDLRAGHRRRRARDRASCGSTTWS